MIKASYFDGMDAAAHEVELRGDGDQLVVEGAAVLRRFTRSASRMAEPFAAAPNVVEFCDGSHCEVPAGDRAALASLMQYTPSWIERWQARWPAALAAIVAMIGFLALAYYKGIPALTQVIVDNMPVSAEQQLGDAAQPMFETQFLQQSGFSDERLAEIDAIFERVRPAARRMPVRLMVRAAPMIGANAFALPNGTIIITDDLVKALIGDGEVPEAEAELAGIFAHEIGHIEHRHSIRGMAHSSFMLAGSWALFGDFSAVAAGLPAVVGKMSHSREMEYEADRFGGLALQRIGMHAGALGDALLAIEAHAANEPNAQNALPEWMRVSLDFVSSHPGSTERAERLQDLDR